MKKNESSKITLEILSKAIIDDKKAILGIIDTQIAQKEFMSILKAELLAIRDDIKEIHNIIQSFVKLQEKDANIAA